MYVEPGGRGAATAAPEDRLQPARARTSPHPTAARSETAELPERSTQRRTIMFSILRHTSTEKRPASEERGDSRTRSSISSIFPQQRYARQSHYEPTAPIAGAGRTSATLGVVTAEICELEITLAARCDR